jgi:hypothetical protein
MNDADDSRFYIECGFKPMGCRISTFGHLPALGRFEKCQDRDICRVLR